MGHDKRNGNSWQGTSFTQSKSGRATSVSSSTWYHVSATGSKVASHTVASQSNKRSAQPCVNFNCSSSTLTCGRVEQSDSLTTSNLSQQSNGPSPLDQWNDSPERHGKLSRFLPHSNFDL
ncbi:hypothetical protein BGZ60DRAFT_88101 [Tricladium varicosporioides]|nr:hypothetical protein BGZ60DRAFT_88101 [Hymenoscyphus varicosporioides]